VNQVGMRATLAEFGPANQTNVIWEDLADSKTVELTANDNTILQLHLDRYAQGAGGAGGSAHVAGYH
jgi:hypothetical protein